VKRLVVALVAVLLLASCASGGHKSSSAAAGGSGLVAGSGSGSSSSSGAGALAGLTSSGASGTSTTGASGRAGATGSGGEIALTPQVVATGGGVAEAESAAPPPVPAKNGNVTVGWFIVDTGTACSQYGVKCQGAADRPYVQALVNWANAHGGLGGYHINPVYYEVNVTDGDFTTQAAAACAALSQDDHAFVSQGAWVDASPQFANCSAQDHMIDIDGSEYPFADSNYSSLGPYLYQAARLRPERWVPSYVNDLIGRGFLTPSTKIGLLRLDIPAYTQLDSSVVKPLLASHGMSLTTDIEISDLNGTDDIGAESSQLSSAVLRMKSAGVTRVLFLDASGEITYFFGEEAQAEGYHPEYGVSSTEGPEDMVNDGLGDQLTNADGVSWLPGNDVVASDDPGGAGAKLCEDITNAAGLNGGTGRDIYCDTMFFLRAVMASHPALTPAAFQQAADAVGSSALTSSTYTTYFAPGIQDGPSTYRDTAFQASCQCFKYADASSYQFPT